MSVVDLRLTVFNQTSVIDSPLTSIYLQSTFKLQNFNDNVNIVKKVVDRNVEDFIL